MTEPTGEPMPDDEYFWYMESVVCAHCEGIGEEYIEDDGEVWVCQHCGGTGIEPGAEDYDGPPPI